VRIGKFINKIGEIGTFI